ncbi:MAG TPA: filamentous hemagglutinin, partial [Desulfobulbaceae bacterium]|nr:filamentous hemagglutinin [Desulfobulbaceae bacterium]
SPIVGSWSATAQTSYTFATAGSKMLYAWAKDAAGNFSASLSAPVTVTVDQQFFSIWNNSTVPSQPAVSDGT